MAILKSKWNKEAFIWEMYLQGRILVDINNGLIYNAIMQQYLGYIDYKGYFTFGLKYQGQMIHFFNHRVIWWLANGPIPDELMINHINGIKTDNRIVNLELVTNQENVIHAYANNLINRDTLSNSLIRYYQENPNAMDKCRKLTMDQANEIRALREQDPKQYSERKLASMYGVNKHTVHEIIHNTSYKI